MLASTSKYALKMMIALAQQDGEDFIRVKDFAKSIKVPAPYLAKIAKTLVQADYLEGRRGPGGGVRISELGRRATFYDICKSVGEPVIFESCFLSLKPCNKSALCPIHPHWFEVCKIMREFLPSSEISDPRFRKI